ncbi:MAG: PBP1A family penicillin-binding protein [Desulfococcaceae bacterium]|jgi:penicillin-binding protein 1A|nr:PBP1A family penicillin-binding protein [Desulfococcaceae bacterium]
MSSISNPYVSGQNRPPFLPFVGRSSIFARAEHFVKQQEQCFCFLYGMPHMGKTSLLHHIKEKRTEQGIPSLYFNPAAFPDKGAGVLLAELARQLCEFPNMPRVKIANRLSPKLFLERFIPHLISRLPEQNSPFPSLILLTDEFAGRESLRFRQDSLLFYTCLRKMGIAAGRKIRFIFALGRRTDDREVILSGIFGKADIISVPPLSPEETAALVRLSEENNTLKWPDTQVTAVRNFTAGHPELTRYLCDEIWKDARKNGQKNIPAVSFRDMGQGFSRSFRQGSPVFERLWHSLRISEKVLVSAIADGGNRFIENDVLKKRLADFSFIGQNGQMHNIAARLCEWGLLESENSAYRIRINMVSRWIMARKPFDRIQEEIRRRADELYFRAKEYYREGQNSAAVSSLENALAILPGTPKICSLLVKIKIRQEKYGDALTILQALPRIHASPLRPLYIRVLLLQAAKCKDSREGIFFYEKILETDPDHSYARSRLQMLRESGDGHLRKNSSLPEEPDICRREEPEIKARQVEESLRQMEIAALISRRKQTKKLRRKLFVWGFLPLVLLSLTAFALYAGYRHISHDLPKIGSLADYRPPQVTSVYAADGQKIGEFYRERRIVIPLSRMPENLIRAFIAAEDARFFSHQGLDYIGIARAFFKNIEAGTVVQGGSTITQQVIKSFLLGNERSYERKCKEAVLAYRIDRAFGKEEILFLYLNQIYLGYGAYGVEAAAENYFGKTAAELNLAECAMLGGLAKAPGKDTPARRPDRAEKRQKYVLRRMVSEGYITQAQADDALKTPLKIQPRQNWFAHGVPYFTEYIRQYMEERYGKERLCTGGLKIYTGIDPHLQEIAREELEKGLKKLESRHDFPEDAKLQGALLCVELESGEVKAMIGGRDYEKSQFNRAVQSRRQPGSAFKPIIYAAALDKGFTTRSILSDTPVSYWGNGKRWTPSNYDGKYYGPVPLRKALSKSRNIPSVRLLNRIGLDYGIAYARKLGIRSHLDRGLSLALGASGVSLLEMVQAYSVFANRGRLIPPLFIRKIADPSGNEITDSSVSVQVIEPATAFLMTSLLQSVVEQGTGYRARELQRPAAGKTGTTNDFRDAWFIGYTPGYITGVWVGFDIERSLGRGEAGSQAALPIWLGFMQRMLEGKPVRQFPETAEGIVTVRLDPATGMRVRGNSAHAVKEYYKEGSQPVYRAPRPVQEPEYKTVVKKEDFFKNAF